MKLLDREGTEATPEEPLVKAAPEQPTRASTVAKIMAEMAAANKPITPEDADDYVQMHIDAVDAARTHGNGDPYHYVIPRGRLERHHETHATIMEPHQAAKPGSAHADTERVVTPEGGMSIVNLEHSATEDGYQFCSTLVTVKVVGA